jgi:DNA helicase-2/ATP-dependent DNA helicase PcrA
VQELLSAIHEFVERRREEGIDFTPIADFLSEVSLLTDQDENVADTTERVTLMTVHAAKGLEFPVVFIVGMEENLFPSQFAAKPSEMEEERRLLYVAITRAKEQCYLSFARQRFRNGATNYTSPSRFLNDIDRQYFELAKPQPASAPAPRSFAPPVQPKPSFTSMSRVSNSRSSVPCAWKAGDRVAHPAFGAGTVVRIFVNEETGNEKIEINFDSNGTKTLLLAFAKLERI